MASHRVDLACGEITRSITTLNHSLSAVLAGAQSGTEIGHGLADSTHGSSAGLLTLMSVRSSPAKGVHTTYALPPLMGNFLFSDRSTIS